MILIKLGNKIITLKYINLSLVEKDEFRKLVGKLLMNKGYTTTYLIYRECIFNKKLSLIIKRLGIHRNEEIFHIVKLLCSNIKGSAKFLYDYKSKYISI